MDVEMRKAATARIGIAYIDRLSIGLEAGLGATAETSSSMFLWQDLLACSIDDQTDVIRGYFAHDVSTRTCLC